MLLLPAVSSRLWARRDASYKRLLVPGCADLVLCGMLCCFLHPAGPLTLPKQQQTLVPGVGSVCQIALRCAVLTAWCYWCAVLTSALCVMLRCVLCHVRPAGPLTPPRRQQTLVPGAGWVCQSPS